MSLPHTLPEPLFTAPSRHAQATLPPEANTATCTCTTTRAACPMHQPWEYTQMDARHRSDERAAMRSAIYEQDCGAR